MGDQPPKRRRQRRRATAEQGAPPAAAPSAAAPGPQALPAAPAGPDTPDPAPRRRRAPREGSGDRGLRDLVGAGRSQLGVSGALRGRDVNRPTEEDLAAADRDVVIIRRNWKPDDNH